MSSNPDRQQLRDIDERLKLLKKEQAERREEIERLRAEREALRERLGSKTDEAAKD